MSDGFSLPNLRRALLHFAPTAPVRLQPFSGSAWRGAFGHALKRLVCAAGLRPCAGCPLAKTCLFPPFFGAEDGWDSSRPYVLAPSLTPRSGWLQPEERLTLRLLLLPAAERATPYVMRALIEAAERGITAARIPFTLCRIETEGAEEQKEGILAPRHFLCPPPPAALTLHFVTPLRLRLGGDLITGRTLMPRHLVAAAIRRLKLLGFAVAPELIATARGEAEQLQFTQARLGWLETTRLSSRQGSRMQLGGILGEAVLDLRSAPAVWPFLWAASILHLGKGCAMGFGQIALTPR